MSGAEFTVEFKRDVVAQVEDRGYPVREVADRLDVSTKSICTWQRQFSRPAEVIHEVDAQADEIRRLKRDLARATDLSRIRRRSGGLCSRRMGHSKYGDRILRQGISVSEASESSLVREPMATAFIAENRLIFAVRAMCRRLPVHPGSVYGWLREPFSQGVTEDQRQTKLFNAAGKESGEVQGYCKLHDDLRDPSEDISPDRAWRLARLAGIRAKIGS